MSEPLYGSAAQLVANDLLPSYAFAGRIALEPMIPRAFRGFHGIATTVIEVGPLGKEKGEPGTGVSTPVAGSIA